MPTTRPHPSRLAHLARTLRPAAALTLLLLASACVRRYPEGRPSIRPERAERPARPTRAVEAPPRSAAGVEPERVRIPLSTVARSGRAMSDVEYLRTRELIVPVAGVSVDRIPDTYRAPRGRDGSRRHEAVDIMAPRGTPVLSADDGQVLKLRQNAAGGTTIYATDPDERIIYYYAHLDRYHGRLREGMKLAKGDTIGFVGTTGNAPKNVPHLHFQVMRMPADGRWWGGEPIDPLPMLVRAAEGR